MLFDSEVIWGTDKLASPLAGWWLIGTANANGSGVISYVNTQATNRQRFYRLGL